MEHSFHPQGFGWGTFIKGLTIAALLTGLQGIPLLFFESLRRQYFAYTLFVMVSMSIVIYFGGRHLLLALFGV